MISVFGDDYYLTEYIHRMVIIINKIIKNMWLLLLVVFVYCSIYYNRNNQILQKMKRI